MNHVTVIISTGSDVTVTGSTGTGSDSDMSSSTGSGTDSVFLVLVVIVTQYF